MTTYEDDHRGTIGTATFAAGIARVAAQIVAGTRRRMRIARDERHLRELPDHMLRDIGLHRSEIPAIVRYGRIEYGG